jgi:glycosyltransferase involved in cell wall biosynthesis
VLGGYPFIRTVAEGTSSPVRPTAKHEPLAGLPAFQEKQAMNRVYSVPKVALPGQRTQKSLMFIYWGTRGSLPLLTRELALVSRDRADVMSTFSISTSNELFREFAFLGDRLLSFDIFPSNPKFLLFPSQIGSLRSRLAARLAADRTSAVISLMPHLLSPLIAPAIRRAGVRHVAIVHDADAHPGDHHALVNWWLLKEAIAADRVIALSHSVAKRLIAARNVPEQKISVLFHPDLHYRDERTLPGGHSDPLRILFLGRILRYKGLPLFIEASEILRNSGIPLKIGVFGQGEIGAVERGRLIALDAEVENRWIDNREISSIFARYDVVVAAHTEASQSGVISAALGSGLPVVATPVGGLVEQLIPNLTGIIADAATGPSLATAIRRLAEDRALLAEMRKGIADTSANRSVGRFFDQICEVALS